MNDDVHSQMNFTKWTRASQKHWKITSNPQATLMPVCSISIRFSRTSDMRLIYLTTLCGEIVHTISSLPEIV